jgi:hypothetical protein
MAKRRIEGPHRIPQLRTLEKVPFLSLLDPLGSSLMVCHFRYNVPSHLRVCSWHLARPTFSVWSAVDFHSPPIGKYVSCPGIGTFNSKRTAHRSRHHIAQETFDTPAEMNVFDDAPLACRFIASIPRGLRARWRKRHIRLAMRNLTTQVTASLAISRKMFLAPLQAARW